MEAERIYILGVGAIGLSLAVHLARAGIEVTAVRTSAGGMQPGPVEYSVCNHKGEILGATVETASLDRVNRMAGIIVVTAKNYANPAIAARLKALDIASPIVLLQNGVGVERPYLELERARVYRCVLYATAQKDDAGGCSFRPITASPIGAVRGDDEELARILARLHTEDFPFRSHSNIQQEVWKKAVINAVFNTVCPLLETDNGIFIRDEGAARLAREIVRECSVVMRAQGFTVSEAEVMEQLLAISKGSAGQLISTLQDLRSGRQTEIEALNLEIARVGAGLKPPIDPQITRVLGELIKIKSGLRATP